MNDKFLLRVQRYGWDAAARTYDELWRENLSTAHQAMFEMAQIKPAEKVFEIACGSGFVTFQVASLVGDAGQILATDISAEMITLVEEQSTSLGLSNIRSERIAAEDIGDLADGSFDISLCALGLMFMPDPEVGMSSIWQALKPGGRAIAVVWGKRSSNAWADIFPIVDNRVTSAVCPLFFSLGVVNSLAQSFEKQGFDSVTERRIETTLNFKSEADLLSAIIDGGAVALAAKRFDVDARAQVEEEFLDSVKVFRNGDCYRIPAEFVVVSGEKPQA